MLDFFIDGWYNCYGDELMTIDADFLKYGVEIIAVLEFEWGVAKERVCGRNFNALSFRFVGDTEFCYDGGAVMAKSGDVILVPAGVDYQVCHGEEKIIAVHFKTAVSLPGNILCETPANPAHLQKLFTKLHKLRAEKSQGYELASLSVFYEILYELDGGDGNLHSQSSGHKTALEAKKFIDAGFTDASLDVSRVCRHVGASGTYLRRFFHELVGMNPSEYITGLRTEYACELLTSGYFSVSKVAELSGFSDPKYFSKIIKKKKGCSPAQLKGGRNI